MYPTLYDLLIEGVDRRREGAEKTQKVDLQKFTGTSVNQKKQLLNYIDVRIADLQGLHCASSHQSRLKTKKNCSRGQDAKEAVVMHWAGRGTVGLELRGWKHCANPATLIARSASRFFCPI